MTPDQTQKLIEAITTATHQLINFMSHKYTITGAADWPILTVVGGAAVAMAVFMYLDLKTTIKEMRNEWKTNMDKELNSVQGDIRAIKKAHEKCKEKCLEGR